jgi:hypothetical protein
LSNSCEGVEATIKVPTMANLDDFFAKKDKKKKGKKFVTANTDVLATKLEENARKEHEAELKAASIANYSGTDPVSIDTSAEGVSLRHLLECRLVNLPK